MKHIIVIGSGVTGLTTAVLLTEKGYKVTIVASYFPGDRSTEYASPFAGAHWRTMARNSEPLLQQFDSIAYKKFIRLGQTLPTKETGIVIAPAYDYYDYLTEDTKQPWFKDVVENFSFIEPALYPHSTTKVGHHYTTVLIDAPQYLTWLLRQFLSYGGKLRRQRLDQINEVFSDDIDGIINCTGLGSLYLGGVTDSRLYPTRGQTVIIKASHVKKTITCLDGDTITYVIPRADGTIILGGTAQKNEFNKNVDPTIADSIIQRTTLLCPELVKDGQPLTIIGHAVGFRPTRLGGVRLENEQFVMTNGNRVTVTHAYGHGGFGYQSSWGSSQYIIQLTEKGLTESKL